jgi:hypothetical protein
MDEPTGMHEWPEHQGKADEQRRQPHTEDDDEIDGRLEREEPVARFVCLEAM